MSKQEEEGGAIPQAQKASWSTFLKQIASSKGDLSSMTAPSFILSPTSLTEFSAYWCEPTEEFLAISAGPDPEDRMLRVLKWFICTLRGQYTARETQTGSEKKPLNPILGELHLGEWETSKGPTKLVSEQVSHHPPITAYHISNDQAGVALQGHCGQKTSFGGKTISVRQVGHALLTVKLPSGEIEKYLITLPKLRIEGLWYGAPYIELSESSYIQSSSGYHTAIAYSGKGYFSGKSHTFSASVSANPSSSSKDALYVIEGQWTETSKYTKGTKGSKAREGQPFLDVARSAPGWKSLSLKPVSEQGPMESRRVWYDVAEGIKKGMFDDATAAKMKLENDQRQKRKDEQASGQTWQLQRFTLVNDDADYRTLARAFGGDPSTQDSYHFKA